MSSRYTDRLAALTDFCHAEYGIVPRDVHFICCCLLKTNAADMPVWGCIETPYSGFWDDLQAALTGVIHDGAFLLQRARYANRDIKQLTDNRHIPVVLLDRYATSPRRLPGVNHQAHYLFAECLRWQVPYGIMRVSKPSVRAELAYLLEGVLDPLGRSYTPTPVQNGTATMSNYIKLLIMLNPDYALNPYALTRNLFMLPSAHACLEGRTELDASDWSITVQAMQSSVREWTSRLLGEFVAKDGAHRVRDLQAATRLPDKLLRGELERLTYHGVLRWKGGRSVWVETGEGWWMETRELMEGTCRLQE